LAVPIIELFDGVTGVESRTFLPYLLTIREDAGNERVGCVLLEPCLPPMLEGMPLFCSPFTMLKEKTHDAGCLA
jgi:hypothetical protein